MTPDQFIAAIAPAARASMASTKIPASFVIAEAALESAWGASQLAAQAFNLFGVKADASWHGPILTMNTREWLTSKSEWVIAAAKWRKYTGWLPCIGDHAAFLLTNRRYQPAFLCGDARTFTRAIARAGYATDPHYADKIISIIDTHNLLQFDNLEKP